MGKKLKRLFIVESKDEKEIELAIKLIKNNCKVGLVVLAMEKADERDNEETRGTAPDNN